MDSLRETISKFGLVTCGLALLTQGCGAPASAEDAPPESSVAAPRTPEETLSFMKETGVVFPPRAERTKAPVYTSYSTAAERTLVNTRDYLCGLEELSGSTTADGASFWAGLWTEHAEERWKIRGTSNVRVGVDCVRNSGFLLPVGAFHAVSHPISASASAGGMASTTLWPGYSFSFLGRLDSSMDGMGEVAETMQSKTATGLNTLNVDTGRWWAMKAEAISYFAGSQAFDRTVRLYGYRDGAYRRGTINSSGTYTFTISNFTGYGSYYMPSTEVAFCAMTRIQGRLGGGDDHVRSYRRNGQWYAELSSRHQVTASFRCMAYDQT